MACAVGVRKAKDHGLSAWFRSLFPSVCLSSPLDHGLASGERVLLQTSRQKKIVGTNSFQKRCPKFTEVYCSSVAARTICLSFCPKNSSPQTAAIMAVDGTALRCTAVSVDPVRALKQKFLWPALYCPPAAETGSTFLSSFFRLARWTLQHHFAPPAGRPVELELARRAQQYDSVTETSIFVSRCECQRCTVVSLSPPALTTVCHCSICRGKSVEAKAVGGIFKFVGHARFFPVGTYRWTS